MKIHYQCSNCGKRFQVSPIPGVPDGMYISGCRAVGDAFDRRTIKYGYNDTTPHAVKYN